MNSLEALNLRTNAALGRLADLQRRAGDTGGSTLIRAALKELTATLEELQVTCEQLQEHVNELAAARQAETEIEAVHREFVNALPLPCLWTDDEGVLVEANEATAMVLNVAARRLAGKPLALFVMDRPAFFDALATLRAGRTVVEVVVQVRPRERRPRQMRLTGQRLQRDTRLCWLLRDAPAAVTQLDRGSVDAQVRPEAH